MQIHGVSTPLHVEELAEGEVHIRERRLGDPLSWPSREMEGLSPERADAICRQLLDALAALHAAKIIHGNIRPEQVYLVKRDGREFVTLGGVAMGHIPFWTNGKSIEGDMQPWLPSEWNGSPQEPAERADVFALGRVCQALFRGLEVRDQDGAERRVQGASGPLRKLLSNMTHKDPHQRPANGVMAVDELRRRERNSRILCSSLGVAVAIAAVACLLWLWSRDHEALSSDLKDTQTELARSGDDLRSAQTELDGRDDDVSNARDVEELLLLRRENADLSSRLADAEGDDSPPPDDATLARRQALWKQNAPDKGLFEESNWSNLETFIGDQPDIDRAQFRTWFDICEPYRDYGSDFIECDMVLKEAYKKFVNAPWEDKEIVQQIAAVERARQLWWSWLRDDRLTFRQVRALIEDPVLIDDPSLKDLVRDVLDRWYRAWEARIANNGPRWSLTLLTGKVPPGHWTERVIVINGNEGPEHEWTSETEHQYQANSNRSRIVFDWSSGSPLTIELWGTGYFGREALLTCPYRGPLPIALLANSPGIFIRGDNVTEIGPYAWTFHQADGYLLPARKIEGVSLRLRNVEGRNIAIDSLEIPRGQFVAVIGKSGIGKTTLLKALLGSRGGSVHGQIEADGRDIRSNIKWFQSRIGYVSQGPVLHETLPADSIVRFASQLRGKRIKDVRILEILRSVGIPEKEAKRPPAKLSGGEGSRVRTAAELVIEPGKLLLDEPTSGLDHSSAKSLMRLLHVLKLRGCTIVVVTHTYTNIQQFDRVLVYARDKSTGKGLIRFDGNPNELIAAGGGRRLEEIDFDLLPFRSDGRETVSTPEADRSSPAKPPRLAGRQFRALFAREIELIGNNRLSRLRLPCWLANVMAWLRNRWAEKIIPLTFRMHTRLPVWLANDLRESRSKLRQVAGRLRRLFGLAIVVPAIVVPMLFAIAYAIAIPAHDLTLLGFLSILAAIWMSEKTSRAPTLFCRCS